MLKANLALLMLVLSWSFVSAAECPIDCVCEHIKSGVKVSCVEKGFKEIISSSSLPPNTTEL